MRPRLLERATPTRFRASARTHGCELRAGKIEALSQPCLARDCLAPSSNAARAYRRRASIYFPSRFGAISLCRATSTDLASLTVFSINLRISARERGFDWNRETLLRAVARTYAADGGRRSRINSRLSQNAERLLVSFANVDRQRR